MNSHMSNEQPFNFAPLPDFKWLCEELFVKIDNIAKTPKVSIKPVNTRYNEAITRFINLWRSSVGNDIYPAFILALPWRDKRTFNIKDVTLVKAICSYLRLPRGSLTETRLLNWKQHATRGERLSKFCVEEIGKRKSEPVVPVSERISIGRLNDILDSLAKAASLSVRGFKNLATFPEFKLCLDNMSFLELTYFFDILLKARIIGGQEHKLLNAWHQDAEDYLGVVSDLRIVTQKLWNPKFRLASEELKVSVGLPFAPQLAKRLTQPYDIICKILNDDFFIEEKMDGERIELHYMDYGQKLRFFSRRGTDYTYLYGESVNHGTIGPYLHLDADVRECIIDGEMITYDTERGIVLPFGIVKTSAFNAIKQEDISNASYHPFYMVFDIVYLNGVSLADVPLYQRKVYLSKVIKSHEHLVEVIQSTRCSGVEPIKRALEKAILQGSEGIVLKNAASKYVVSSRNDGWIKLKPEYLSQFGENMDLIVIGRDSGKKDRFMCGLVVRGDSIGDTNDQHEPHIKCEDDNNGSDDGVDSDGLSEGRSSPKGVTPSVVSFCTIANGISQEEYKEIDRRTRGFWKRYASTPPPENMLRFGKKIPVEWIAPQDSVVLEVKARSINNTLTNAENYAAGCTLHGGYCRQVRYDKGWQTCHTLAQFLRDRQYRTGVSNVAAEHSVITRKRAKRGRSPKVYTSLSATLSTRTTNGIFNGLYFYVITDFVHPYTNRRLSRDELAGIISENGGTVLYNVILDPMDPTSLRIIGDKITIECKELIRRGYDIINPLWITDCINNGHLLDLEPNHCTAVSDELYTLAQGRLDRFGDSYSSIMSNEKLDFLIKSFSTGTSKDIETVPDISDCEISKIPLFLFQSRRAFIPPSAFTKSLEYEIRTKISLYGGTISEQLEDSNLVIVPDGNGPEERRIMEEIREKLSSRVWASMTAPSIPNIVTPKWIDSSLAENVQVPEEDFTPLI